jgi:hypothetical protein
LVLTGVVSVFAWPVIAVLPAYTKLQLHLDADAYSLLLSALGAGALCAALLTATFGSAARRGAFLLVGVAAAAAGLTALGFTDQVELSAIDCGAIGFGLILYLSTGQSVLQLAVPDAMRGRVMAWWAMTLSASAPLGHLLSGELLKSYGIQPVVFGMAAGLAAASAALAALLIVRGVSTSRA